ncbi:MAG TPA: hypothetical protein VM537_25370 [Anaerolineae bacterium]|nr:hypothetical protein [Anaerolineae bacterium]
MNAVTQALYDRLAGDGILIGMLATYEAEPAVFTIDPAPGDAVLPYIVSAGDVVDAAWDTKTGLGRRIWRDVRCYAAADGDAMLIEEIAERVRRLLHRRPLAVAGYAGIVAECSGPIKADEQDAYGRIVTIRMMLEET